MEVKMSAKNVLVIDLNNNQESYSHCIEIIELIEEFKNKSNNVLHLYDSVIKKMEEYRNTKSEHRVYFTLKLLNNNTSKRYYEEPLYDNDGKIIPVLQPIAQSQKKLKFINSAITGELYFHIRVHFDYCNEYSGLHYLAMTIVKTKKIFEKMEDTDFSKRFSAFLVPLTNNKFPFKDRYGNIDYETFKKSSSYLRIITKSNTGILFGVNQKDNNPEVTALEFHAFTRNDSLFPLLYIEKNNTSHNYNYLDKSTKNKSLLEKNSSEINNYALIFEQSNMPNATTVERSFKGKLNTTTPYNFASSSNPKVAIADYILDCSRERLLCEFSDTFNTDDRDAIINAGKIRIADYIDYISEIASENDRMAFALFSFLLKLPNTSFEYVRERIANVFNLAIELSTGIRQIV